MRRTRTRNTRTNKRSKISKRRISRKNYKKKHSKKNYMKGGNFGGNCPDPNFSIYNTNLLKLFPYSTFGKG
jgi:hypothetical protein